MSTILRQLALVSETNRVNFKELARVSAALQKQATRDLGPIWEVEATVDAFDNLDDVPLGYWPMIVKDDIGLDGAAGVHQDDQGQPFALITAGKDWSLTASHEALEMLVDPFGNRLVAGDSPDPDQGRVEFLVEVSDPSEASEFGYPVNGVLVSDFYTPSYFDPVKAPGVRYSFTGAIVSPRDVLRGGYLSWHEPVTDIWFQETWFDGDESEFRELGQLTGKTRSLRSQVDELTNRLAGPSLARGQAPALMAARPSSVLVASGSSAKARQWRDQIEGLLAKPKLGVSEETGRSEAAPPRRRQAPNLSSPSSSPNPVGPPRRRR
ncbi:hypothetical protein SAMN05444166_0219 [Singulisphaera sp. GP187]|uniref:hypothetical protein n=1 Tax=Singulisphaera sp. GP187 TaxID=1882752 RepID=UPI00092C6D70|nr:hypothetical protein [Singulisphaera sp. GP187]SIN69932.1 hypothetical protein SAMN05444166_0219 [Singulisphaera sp. GP187]